MTGRFNLTPYLPYDRSKIKQLASTEPMCPAVLIYALISKQFVFVRAQSHIPTTSKPSNHADVVFEYCFYLSVYFSTTFASSILPSNLEFVPHRNEDTYAKNNHEQKLQTCISALQYQVSLEEFLHSIEIGNPFQ